MSDGTEQDESEQVGDGDATPGAGAPAGTVWPVWGGPPTVPADGARPDATPDTGQGADAEAVSTQPTVGEPKSEPESSEPESNESESEAAESEPEPEPESNESESESAGSEPEPESTEPEPESETTQTTESETTESETSASAPQVVAAESTPEPAAAESAPDAGLPVSTPEPEPEPESAESASEPLARPQVADDESSQAPAAEPAESADDAEQAVEPEPVVATEPEPTPDPELIVATAPVPTSEPEPTPEPEPIVATDPEPTPEPEPIVATDPEPTREPEPIIATDAEPTREAGPIVATEPELEPVAATDPEPTPEPEPVVATKPEPTRAPEPIVATESAPTVAPEPTPEPEAVPAADHARGDETEVIAPVVAAAAATAATTPVRVSAMQPAAPPVAPTPPPVAAPTPPAPTQSAPTPPAPTPAAQPSAPVVADPPPAQTAVLPPVVDPAPAAGGFAPVTAAAAAQSSTIQAGRVPSSERAASPLDVFEPEDRRRRWPRRLLWILGIVLVLCAAYVGASFAVADTVPRGASVAGVDIGGLKSAEAVARLDSELADETTKPIPVLAEDVQATLDPTTAGLTFDAQATVDELTGVNLADPKRLWDHIIGIGEQPPVTSVDAAALAASVDGLGTALQLLPVDGTILYVDATAQSTDAVDGWELDAVESAKVITRDWLVAPRPLELPTTTVPPTITQEKTDAALTEATKVTSAPVSVMVSGQVALLDAATLAANASYTPTDGNLVLRMNGEGLTAAILKQVPNVLTASADAHFEFVDGAPVIVPGTPGTTLDPATVASAVATAAVSNDRSATVELVESDPSQSTAALEQLGVKEIVSEFSTPLTSEPRRTINITNGASKINGTLIKPGDTFSLTEALGPIDAAHGFVEAGAIISGEHTDAWGGGLSQVSTTSYNAGFLAGYEDVEHRPHSEWFARYPEGREATIFTGTLDMRWKNNTPYGALVQAWVADNRVYVRVWSTKYWTVESITSPRSGVVQPTTVYSQSPTCEASSAGNPGFTVTVTRKTSLNGELVKTEANTWRYKPQNKIICGPAPVPTP